VVGSRELFECKYRRVVDDGDDNGVGKSQATLKISVDGKEVLAVAEGVGPVDAMNRAIRQALKPFYPEIEEVGLNVYDVSILNGEEGTSASVEVRIRMCRSSDFCEIVEVSGNILAASFAALRAGYAQLILGEGGQK